MSKKDGPLVLVVDDFADAREMYGEYLKFCGFRVAEAQNGVEAIEKAKKLKPDLILMDLSMPLIDGWEATRRLKGDGATKDIPVVALTGHAMAGHSESAKSAGCDVVITKPCLPHDLIKQIRKVIGGPQKKRIHRVKRRKAKPVARKRPARKTVAPRFPPPRKLRRDLAAAQSAKAGSQTSKRRKGRVTKLRPPSVKPMRWNPDPEEVQRSVIKLVLSLVEFIRKLMERQAVRRLEANTLTPEEIENVGLALMRLEETVRQLATRFKLDVEDLNLDLGPIGRLH